MVANLDIARRQTMYLLFFFPRSRELTPRKSGGNKARPRERRHPVYVVCRSTLAGLSRQESEPAISTPRRRPATNGTRD